MLSSLQNSLNIFLENFSMCSIFSCLINPLPPVCLFQLDLHESFWKIHGPRFFELFLDHLSALVVSFPISHGGIHLISTKLISMVVSLRNWALIATTITTRFILNHHPLLKLEMISASTFGPFPFETHLKLAGELLPLDMVACVVLFMQFVERRSNWI